MSQSGYIQKIYNSLLLAFLKGGLNIELPYFYIRLTDSNRLVLLKFKCFIEH